MRISRRFRFSKNYLSCSTYLKHQKIGQHKEPRTELFTSHDKISHLYLRLQISVWRIRNLLRWFYNYKGFQKKKNPAGSKFSNFTVPFLDKVFLIFFGKEILLNLRAHQRRKLIIKVLIILFLFPLFVLST